MSAMNFLKCSLVTCSLPASPSRNPSTRTYSDGSSRLRDQSNHRLPGSLRVASVKSATRSGKLSTYSGFGLNLTTMKIMSRSSLYGVRMARPRTLPESRSSMADWKSSSCVLLRVQVHRAPRRECHQVAQVVVGPDQVADEVDLGGDDVDRRHVDVLAVADDVVIARAAQHRARPRWWPRPRRRSRRPPRRRCRRSARAPARPGCRRPAHRGRRRSTRRASAPRRYGRRRSTPRATAP